VKPYLLHPAAVHFPLALLVTGLAGALAARLNERWAHLADAVSWLLWLGTASAWAVLALGYLAERTAPHVPPAWETLALHKTLAFWTVGAFTALSLWRAFYKEKGEWLFLALWAVAASLILATGFQGGELVFTYNMGTAASAE